MSKSSFVITFVLCNPAFMKNPIYYDPYKIAVYVLEDCSNIIGTSISREKKKSIVMKTQITCMPKQHVIIKTMLTGFFFQI